MIPLASNETYLLSFKANPPGTALVLNGKVLSQQQPSRLCEKKILVSINIDSAATILQARLPPGSGAAPPQPSKRRETASDFKGWLYWLPVGERRQAANMHIANDLRQSCQGLGVAMVWLVIPQEWLRLMVVDHSNA